MVQRDADVNVPGGWFDCPLAAAAYRGQIEVMRFLTEKGAKPNGNYGKADDNSRPSSDNIPKEDLDVRCEYASLLAAAGTLLTYECEYAPMRLLLDMAMNGWKYFKMDVYYATLYDISGRLFRPQQNIYRSSILLHKPLPYKFIRTVA